MFDAPAFDPHEEVHPFLDPETGFKADALRRSHGMGRLERAA
jgi:hypothetical protein